MILKTVKENATTTKQDARKNERENEARAEAQNIGKKSKK